MNVKTDIIKRILLVDDSPVIRRGIGLFLRKNGFKVEDAENGLQALSIAEKSKFDLILLDYVLPIMTGYEILLLFKASEELQKIPVIMLTSQSDKENIIECLKYGATDYIIKSNDLNILLKKICDLLDVSNIT